MEGSPKSTLGKFFGTTRKPKNKPCWNKPEDSTGEIYQGINLGGKFCWEAQGPARETFLVLASEIKAYLNSQSDPVPSPVTWTLYMIGSTRQSSRPTVMFCSADKSARKTIKERIDKSGLLDKYPGFDTGGCSQEFRRFATENEAGALNSEPTMEDTMEEKSIFYSRSEVGPGMYVYIPGAETSSSLRRTRCGGIVYNHDRCFLQTVAHAFTETENTGYLATNQEESCEFEFELEDHHDTDNEDEDVEMSSRGSATPEYVGSDDAAMSVCSSAVSTVSWSLTDTPGPSQHGEGVDNHLSSTILAMPGNNDPQISMSSAFGLNESLVRLRGLIILSTSGAQPDLDYCLIEIPPSELIYFDDFLKNRCSTQTVLSPKFIAREEPATATVTITRMDDPFNGTLSGTPTFMMLPGHVSVQEIWAVRHNGTLTNGDCGSWVVDASNGALYGHIVAGDPRLRTAYIIPAYLIFDDLRNRFGGEWRPSKTDQVLEHGSSPDNNTRVDEHDPKPLLPQTDCRVTEPLYLPASSGHRDLCKHFSLTSQGYDNLYENDQEDQNNIPEIETHGKETWPFNLHMPFPLERRLHSTSSSELSSEEGDDVFSSAGGSVTDPFEFVPGMSSVPTSQSDIPSQPPCLQGHVAAEPSIENKYEEQLDPSSTRTERTSGSIELWGKKYGSSTENVRNQGEIEFDWSLVGSLELKFVVAAKGGLEGLEQSAEKKISSRGDRRILTSEQKKKADSIRRIRACWSCWLLKKPCSTEEVCKTCMKLPVQSTLLPQGVCSRTRLSDHEPLFFPEYLVSHLSMRKVEELVCVHTAGFSTTNITIEVSTGAAFKPLKLNATFFQPKSHDISTTLLRDFTADFSKLTRNWGVSIGVKDLSSSDMGKLCIEHIESMIANPLYPRQTTAGIESSVVHEILDASQKYRPASFVDSLLIKSALKLHAMHYFMSRVVTLTEDSVMRVREVMEDHTSMGDPHMSSPLLNHQIKCAMHKVHQETTKAVLEGLERSLRRRSKDSWGPSFCAILILCLCIEDLEIAADIFVACAIMEDGLPSTYNRKQSLDVCTSLEELPFALITRLFHAVYRSQGKRGFDPLANIEDKRSLDPATRDLIDSMCHLIEGFGDEMRVLAERTLSTILGSTVEPFNMTKNNNGRLVSKFLLSFFPNGTYITQSSK